MWGALCGFLTYRVWEVKKGKLIHRPCRDGRKVCLGTVYGGDYKAKIARREVLERGIQKESRSFGVSMTKAGVVRKEGGGGGFLKGVRW